MLFFLLALFISYQSFAACTADATFKTFATNSNLFRADNPHALLSQYSQDTGTSLDCSLEKTQSLIPQFVISSRNEGNAKGCFALPPKASCPKDLRDDIFGNITLLDEWSLYLKQHDGIPTQSLCQESLGIAPEAERLTGDIADILSVMNKMRRLEEEFSLQGKDCKDSQVIDVSGHPQYKKFLQVYQKGDKAQLSDYLLLWDKSNENKIDKPYFFSCQSNPWGVVDRGQMVDRTKYVVDECKPDVLYSWGPQSKLNNIKKNLPTNKEWRGDPNSREGVNSMGLFMALTPAQTFGYGDVLVRLKLKRETPVALWGYHVAGSTEDERIGVRARNGDSYVDYTLDKASYIESYSYGTPEIYDELVLDVQRFMSKKRAQAYPTGAALSRVSKAKTWKELEERGIKNLTGHNIDNFDFSQKELEDRFRKLLAMIIEKKGAVHFQKGVCQSVKKHYETDKPTYFNPR